MIQLGYEVKDIITGLVGISMARTEWLYGCTRITVQPKDMKDGKPVDDVCFDEQRVEQTGDSPVLSVATFDQDPCGLGNEVRDTLTGFQGICAGITHWVTGEVAIIIEPPKLHEGVPVKPQWFNAKRVQLVEKKAPPVSAQSSARSGGPQNDPKRF